MEFPLGKPILAMIVAALACGGAILCRHGTQRPDLSLWVFAEAHAKTYALLEPDAKKLLGKTLGVSDAGDSINARLSSLFTAGITGRALPDAAEVEIGSIGRFFRPPADEVGFLPLNHYLETTGLREIATEGDPGQKGWHARNRSDGKVYSYDGLRWVIDPSVTRPDSWKDRLVAARLFPWSKQGVIFGVPHDVHPVTLTFREDLFREAGIDLASAKTWAELRHQCIRFQRYWSGHGYPRRHAMELHSVSSDDLVIMLQQRHLNLVDERDEIHIADEKCLRTLLFYSSLIAGDEAIYGEANGNPGLWVNDLGAGNVCCCLTPDWRVDLLRRYGSTALSGKLRMMPLPRFDPDDAATATWGGTMIGIPRHARDPEQSWKLIEFLYFSPEGLKARLAESDVISAMPEQWIDPAYQKADPLFGGQCVSGLYIELATRIPPRHVTPVTNIAQITLSVVLSNVVNFRREQGQDGLEEAAKHWLWQADRDIRRRVAHARFEPDFTPANEGEH